jgi:perosamine synthetase
MGLRSIPRGIVYHSINYDIINLFRSLFGKRNGEEVKKFECFFADYMKSAHCVSFSYARTAIYAALKAAHLPEKSEIIMPPITIKPILDMVLKLGLKVVFVDIERETLCYNLEQLKKSITSATKAINITYLYGIVPDVEAIVSLCRKHGLFIIEDFSHNLNAEFKGKKLGTFGDVGVFSASSVKAFDMYGAGLLITDNSELGKKIAQFQAELSQPPRSFLFDKVKTDFIRNMATSRLLFALITMPAIRIIKLFSRGTVIKFIGNRDQEPVTEIPADWFHAIDPFQCKIGFELLHAVGENDEIRIANVQWIKKRLDGTGIEIEFPEAREDSKCVFWQFVFYPKDPMKAQDKMHSCHVDTATTSLSLISQMNGYPCRRNTPIAEKIHRNALFIPAFPSLSENDLHRIVNVLNRI